jgi:hypothetical protein
MLAALLIIAFEFTNLFTFIAHGGTIQNTVSSSMFIPVFASYGVCVLIFMLDTASAVRLLRMKIFVWAVTIVGLFTWGMFIRTFNSPAGIEDYDLLHEFGAEVNYIAFLVSCVYIFDQPDVLALVKRAVVVATIAGVILNIYDVMNPGTFSIAPGRGAGLYVGPNGSGVTLVLGCIIGLTALRHRFSREVFVLVSMVGVLATFSREAFIAFILLMVVASMAGVWSIPRLSFMIGGAIVLFIGLNVVRNLEQHQIINPEGTFMTTFRLYSDSSVQQRAHLAQDAIAEFEQAPLLGHGFATTVFWTDDAQSHNAYLSYLDDYGIFGIFVIPALLLSMRRASWDYYAFAGSFLVVAFFHHMILSDLCILVCLAIEASEASVMTFRGQSRLTRSVVVNPAAELRLDRVRSGRLTGVR